MKKTLLFASLALACAVLLTACNSCNSNKFKQAENVLLYRFETTNPEGEQPQAGDVMVGE
jgi:ABC-type oligopeptide transport system substrate-binding subunit